MKFSFFRVATATLVSAWVSVIPVSAQTEAAGSLKEVLVTATRVDQSLLMAPIGSSVLLEADIMRSGVTDANEAIRKLGGVFARRDLNGGREATIDLRGYGDAAASNVVVLVDGIRISEDDLANARLSGIPADMIDRIEITRGGSAVLWGQGATGGVIHVITKSPGEGLYGSASAGVESFGGYDASGSVSGSAKNFSWFANGRQYHSDGFRKNNAFDGTTVNAGASFGEASTLKAKFGLFSEKLDMRWAGALPIADFLVDRTQTKTPKDNGSSRFDRAVVTLEKIVGDATFTTDFAQRVRNERGAQFDDFDGINDVQSQSTSYQFSPRVTLDQVIGSVNLNTVAGLDFYQWSSDASRIYSSPSFSSALYEQGDQSSQAAYIRLNATLASGWRIDSGVRAERFSQTITDKTSGVKMESSPSLQAAEFGVSYALLETLTAYSRIASSYRLANIDELRYRSAVLLPQQARDAELGLRFRTAASTVDVRVFQQSTTNEIGYDPSAGFGGFGENVNLDPVQRNGAELDVSHRFNPAIKFNATFQAIDAKLSSGAYAGSRLPLSASTIATARMVYSPDNTNSVDLALRAVGSMKFGNDWANTCADIAAAQFVDVAYRYKSSTTVGWSFRAGVDNLTDQQTYSTGYTNSSCSAFNVYPDVGRNLKLNASYRF